MFIAVNNLCVQICQHVDTILSLCAVVDSSSSFNRFQFKHNYLKFIPKTQSLDIVDEASISGITTSESSFESINEELMQTDSSSADDTRKTSKPMLIMPKLTSLDNNTAASAQSRPIFPNLSFSPYGSPRISRKPAVESRRVSIDKNGSFLQLNQYKLMDQIGVGSYGLVKLAYNEEDSQHYAMKILSKKKLLRKAGIGFSRGHPKRGVNATTPLDRVYREVAVLKKLDHPNVVKLVEVLGEMCSFLRLLGFNMDRISHIFFPFHLASRLDDPSEDALYMVFELVAKGPVLDIPSGKPLSEDYAWFIFRQVILGVEYLHYQKIIHGDLKPENLLLADHDVVKVADLGVCNEFLGDDSSIDQRTASGTPAFRAPETLSGTGLVFDGKKADIWSMGVTLFAFVTGDIPFKNQAIPKLYEQIQNEEVSFPAKISISDDIRDFITKMLDKNPEKRINMEQIKVSNWRLTQ